MKSLTAIISLYNSGRWLDNRLHNLFQSSIIGDMDIICVNADSPDVDDDIIPKRYNVKYIKLDNRVSVYEAWNIAIKESNSKYLTNANTDDIVSNNCYEKLISTIELNNSDFAYPSWLVTALENQKWSELKETDRTGSPGHYCGDLDKSGVGHFPLWKSQLHTKYGYFNKDFKALGDAEWWARCYYKGQAKFVWVREYLACYLWRNGENLWNKSINEHEWNLYHTLVNQYKNA